MTDHGIHHVHPVRRLGLLSRQYPWSILWVLFTAGMAALVRGAWEAVLIIVILSCIIGLHSARRDRMADRRPRK